MTDGNSNQEMNSMRYLAICLLPALLACSGAGLAETALPATVRLGPPDKAIAVSVAPPSGAPMVYVSGTIADPVDPSAPTSSTDRYGDTETQTRSILSKIEAALADQGMSLSDVVMMRVFLVAPPGMQQMDFKGMTRAYLERFGTADQPNRPARSTVEVAGLVEPGLLAEIEVTAAKGGK